LRPLKDLHDGQTGKDYWFCLPGITNAVVVAALIRVNVGDGAGKRHWVANWSGTVKGGMEEGQTNSPWRLVLVWWP